METLHLLHEGRQRTACAITRSAADKKNRADFVSTSAQSQLSFPGLQSACQNPSLTVLLSLLFWGLVESQAPSREPHYILPRVVTGRSAARCAMSPLMLTQRNGALLHSVSDTDGTNCLPRAPGFGEGRRNGQLDCST